jgi:folate-dependent phosphoribosylglycinamide formyltransferase PurN
MPTMKKPSIILLAGKWDTTAIVYNFLQQHFHIEKVILEDGVPKKEFLKKRISKLGWLTVGGQVFFQLLVAKPLRMLSKNRIAEIIKGYSLDQTEIPQEKILSVSSVNGVECLQALQQLSPAVVVVHGTRIIAKKILQGVSCPFVNIHAGITPRYRGSHGAYWALANNDKENCGVTVHFVDAGIDTGNIIAQEKIPFTKRDNFATYSYLQLAVGLQLLQKSLAALLSGEKIEGVKNNMDSALWHHPTLTGYLIKRLTRKVK